MHVSFATLVFAAYLGFVAADSCTQQPTGYDTTPGILAISSPDIQHPVTAGSDATITWNKLASTASTVSLVLCKGPATNCVPIACIKNGADNNAQSYTWQVPTSLVPSGSSGGYGIKIIEDGTGRFQYSTQFGVLNPNYSSSASSSTSAVQQISDGQVQNPTQTATLQSTKAAASNTKLLFTPSIAVAATGNLAILSTAGLPSYYIPQPSGKISNSTIGTGAKYSYAPNTAPAGALKHTTKYLSSTGAVTAPSGVNPVTQTAIATAGGAGGAVGTGAGGSGQPSSSQSPIVHATGAAAQVVAGGFLAGVGAVAALVL